MRAAAAVVALVTLLIVVRPASAGPTEAQTITVRYEVESISAAGGRLAIEAAFPYPDQACYSGFVWTPSTHRLVDLRDPCKSYTQYVGLTLARDTAIWWDYDSGNHVYCDDVYTESVAHPTLARGLGLCDGTTADQYFRFAGDGNIVTLTDYTRCEANCIGPNGGLLPDGNYDVRVRVLRAGKLRTVLPPRNFRNVLDAGNWRIAAIERGAVLTVYDAHGTSVWRLKGVRGVLRGWIAGDAVIVQQRNSLHTYSARGVGPARTLSKGAYVDDIAGGLALYRAGSSLHVLRLRDGRDRTLATAKGLVGGQITPAGVFYAVGFLGGLWPGGPKIGHFSRVTFLPLADVLRKLR